MHACCIGLYLSFLGTAAAGQDWIEKSPNQSDRAFHQAQDGEKTLMLGCFTGGRDLSFTLIGGKTPLHASLHGQPALLVWITLADGRTGRYPVDTEYLGGGLLLGEEGKQFFAQGVSLTVRSTDAGAFFQTGLRGSARAMQDFLTTSAI
ncbi:hypothetical protein FNJ84_07330 [Paracoccus sp. M683]|uniref:hypothetical protein n=1 Tax=Paracoccus sp. M683 TaxID=2594268 RepID=UPI0011815ADD|nr:hypothetical protein [Paracoccus sp. M683]TRW97323.1 hypothetical protein FNJ84_07330 [Paracoccus sp. M683]